MVEQVWIVDGLECHFPNGMTIDEVGEYARFTREKHPDDEILEISLDGEYVDLHSFKRPIPFERIRRITGYLVGTTARWNNAKTAELADRTVHNVTN